MSRMASGIGLGVLLVMATAAVTAVVNWIIGPLFGARGWRDITIVLLLAEAVVLGILAVGPGSAPGLRRWDAHADPQATFPLMGAKPGIEPTEPAERRWVWVAVPVIVTALGLGVTLLV